MGNSRSNHHDLVLREMPQKVRELHYAVMSNDKEAVRVLVQQVSHFMMLGRRFKATIVRCPFRARTLCDGLLFC